MARILTLILALAAWVGASAETFSFRFSSTPLSKTMHQIIESHPSLDINFTYNDLENYTTSATVQADNAYDALRQAIGQNPVTVTKARGTYYVEAMQHGRYIFSGCVAGADGEPLVGTSVMLLAPGDSAVVTFGIADAQGCFRIPCDCAKVIAKLSCMGYDTQLIANPPFDMGLIKMREDAIMLRSLTVNADAQTAMSDRIVFRPTARQKQNANGAVDLLAQMALPMLTVDQQSGAVTTNAKQAVAIFINASAATEQDLEGLNPEEVKTVEYLIHPMDARYHHKPYVINITLRQLQYGGYAKLRAVGNLVAGSASALAYTKFAFRRMTYDVSLYDYNLDSHHGGSEGSQTYALAGGERVTRQTSQSSFHTQSNRFTAAMRAKYEDEGKSLANRLTLSYTSQPHSDNEGSVLFSTARGSAEAYALEASRRTVYPTWQGEYFFNLGRGATLSVNPNFHYYHVSSDSRYSSEHADIQTIARENVVEGSVMTQINKQINDSHGLNLSLRYIQNHDKINYTGSAPSVQTFNDLAAVALLSYYYNTRKLYTEFSVGGAYEWNRIDGQTTHDVPPVAYVSIQYAFDKKRSLEAEFNYATNTTDISSKGGNVVQSNEYLYITGNPRLKNSRHISADLSYSWAPSNALSMSADLGYFEIFKRPTAIYLPYLDGTAVLRTVENSGNYANEYAGLSFTSRLLGSALVLNFKPQLWLYQTTGEYAERRAAFLYNLSAGYYFGPFYASAYFHSGDDMLVQYSMTSSRTKTRSTWGLSLGWGNGKWTLRASAQNPFRRSWRGDESWLNGRYFTAHQTEFSRSSHQWFQFTATYTFSYGKKVRKGDEVTADPEANSAILQ